MEDAAVRQGRGRFCPAVSRASTACVALRVHREKQRPKYGCSGPGPQRAESLVPHRVVCLDPDPEVAGRSGRVGLFLQVLAQPMWAQAVLAPVSVEMVEAGPSRPKSGQFGSKPALTRHSESWWLVCNFADFGIAELSRDSDDPRKRRGNPGAPVPREPGLIYSECVPKVCAQSLHWTRARRASLRRGATRAPCPPRAQVTGRLTRALDFLLRSASEGHGEVGIARSGRYHGVHRERRRPSSDRLKLKYHILRFRSERAPRHIRP